MWNRLREYFPLSYVVWMSLYELELLDNSNTKLCLRERKKKISRCYQDNSPAFNRLCRRSVMMINFMHTFSCSSSSIQMACFSLSSFQPSNDMTFTIIFHNNLRSIPGGRWVAEINMKIAGELEWCQQRRDTKHHRL